MSRFDVFAYYTDTAVSHGMATREQLVKSMQRYDTSAIALVSGVAADCDFVTGNQSIREIASVSEGIYGLVTLNLAYPEESLEQQRLHLMRREFLASVVFGRVGFPVTLSDAQELVNAQRRYAKPIAIYTPDAEAVHEASKIAAEFTGIKFILLNMGGDDWHAAVTAAKRNLNIYLELSGSLDTDKVSHASTVLTPRKLLYGSALPYSNPELIAAMIDDAATLTASDRNRVYYQNAESLFSVQPETD